MDKPTRNLLKHTEGLSLGYRFFWRLQYTLLGFFGPPDSGTSAGPRDALVAERRARVEDIKNQRGEQD